MSLSLKDKCSLHILDMCHIIYLLETLSPSLCLSLFFKYIFKYTCKYILNIYVLYLCFCVCVHRNCVDRHAAAWMWRSENNLKESTLSLPCGRRGLNSGHPSWWLVPLPTEQSCLFPNIFEKDLFINNIFQSKSF